MWQVCTWRMLHVQTSDTHPLRTLTSSVLYLTQHIVLLTQHIVPLPLSLVTWTCRFKKSGELRVRVWVRVRARVIRKVLSSSWLMWLYTFPSWIFSIQNLQDQMYSICRALLPWPFVAHTCGGLHLPCALFRTCNKWSIATMVIYCNVSYLPCALLRRSDKSAHGECTMCTLVTSQQRGAR